MTYKNDVTRMGCLATPLCLDLSLFDQTNLSSVPFSEQVSLFPSQLFSWLPPIAFISSPLIPAFLKPCRSLVSCLSALLSAVRVVFMVVVLSLCLLVTEEVAPPASRVVHLFGRPSTPHLLHFLRETET